MEENALMALEEKQSQSPKVSLMRYRCTKFFIRQSSRLNLLLLLALMLAWRDPGLTNSREYISHLMETRPGDEQLKRWLSFSTPTRSTISVFQVGAERIPMIICETETETSLPNCGPMLDGIFPSK